MLNRKVVYVLLLSLLFGKLSANDSLKYLVRSYNLEKIRSYFRSKTPQTESELYALIRFQEEHPDGNGSEKYRLLVSLIKGEMVDSVRDSDIDQILSNPLSRPDPIRKTAYWKLYHELTKRNKLNFSEKIRFLQKLPYENDPIVQNAIEEILELYSDAGQFSKAVAFAENFSPKDQAQMFTPMILFRYAKALYKSGNQAKARQINFVLLEDSSVPSYIKKFIFQDLSYYEGSDYIFRLPSSRLAFFLSHLSKSDTNYILRNRKDLFDSIYTNPTALEEVVDLGLKEDPDSLLTLLKANEPLLSKEPEILADATKRLSYDHKASLALKILQNTEVEPEDDIYYSFYLAFDKLHRDKEAFHNLVSSLQLYPYDLYRQDRLVDMLIGENGRNFLPDEYWEDALRRIPDLPVKGRLVYWYLRYLKKKGRTQTLREWLENYYARCPGSYYTRVIREEFVDEFNHIEAPLDPLANRADLFRYLSFTAGRPDISQRIIGQDLGFAYYPGSIELAQRLQRRQSFVRDIPMLQNAKSYLEIGEFSEGVSLVNRYAEMQGLDRESREEIMIAVGDQSQSHYLSLYYTRSLMKRYQIPDDTILLPQSITDRIYPRPHRDIVHKYSHEFGIGENMVYALMRQESFFKENAVSRSRARGLMQIMRPTGEELARKLGLRSYSFFDPEISIQMGAKFLKYLVSSNDGDLRWASIAYNGGPGNLRKWKRRYYHGDFNHFLEELPVKEPRDYCRIIMSNFYNYENLNAYYNR